MRNLAITMSALAGIGIGGAAVGLGANAPAVAHGAAAPGAIDDCPDTLPDGTPALTCGCTAEAAGSGSVWGGPDAYTDDSFICRAAVHAGVISPRGGVVEVRATEGRSSYLGNPRNGVNSSNWGAWDRSIAFNADGNDRPEQSVVAACPPNAVSYSGTGECDCSPGAASASGSVWGSGPYTADSNICRAAVHAGVIGRGGGVVRFRLEAGRPAYPASTRNGISTSRWASYNQSLVFER